MTGSIPPVPAKMASPGMLITVASALVYVNWIKSESVTDVPGVYVLASSSTALDEPVQPELHVPIQS